MTVKSQRAKRFAVYTEITFSFLFLKDKFSLMAGLEFTMQSRMALKFASILPRHPEHMGSKHRCESLYPALSRDF